MLDGRTRSRCWSRGNFAPAPSSSQGSELTRAAPGRFFFSWDVSKLLNRDKNFGMPYQQMFSRRKDRAWMQPLRIALHTLGNGYLFSWAKRMLPAGPLRLLDIACGDGIFRRYMPSSYSYTGADFSERPLRRAKRYFPGRYCRADLNHLPFATGSFDVAVSFQTFQYLENPQLALAELSRVLRPNGLLLLTVPNRLTPKYRNRPPAFQVHTFDCEYLTELLSPYFAIRSIEARGRWIPFPRVSIHLPGENTSGLSWTVAAIAPLSS